MSSITLDTTQSQIPIPDSNQITSDKVTGVASSPAPSVTFENVKSKNTDTPKTGKANIWLDPPTAAMNDVVNEYTLKTMAVIQNAVGLYADALHSIGEITRSSKVTVMANDASEFTLQLAKLTEQLKGTQFSLKSNDLNIAKAKHEQEMSDNSAKINESEAAAQSAKKANLASNILGWVSSAVSIVVGAVTIAASLGTLTAAGALMIAGGVMGIVNQSVQQFSDASDEFKKIFGYVSMAIDMALTLAATALTGGVYLAAKFGVKSAVEMSTKIAAKSVSTGVKQFSLAAQGMDLATGIASGGTQVASNAAGSKSASLQSDLSNMKADMDANRFQMEKIQEMLKLLMEEFQDLLVTITKMLEDNSDSNKRILANTPKIA
ncbi:type III secretion system translocon subunit SctE [Vibrio caribbeanicus]|uniref:type III secretion system translocon subunit SctE n=1 Tax=Vibrio caribbeanicus TaxID=701175 RepID=UPI0030DA61C9